MSTNDTKKARRGRGKQDWATPPDLYELLDAEFLFQLDAAAHRRNAKHSSYLGPDHPDPGRRDSLRADWTGLIERRCIQPAVFVNPPYCDIEPWVAKGIAESRKGLTVVMVLPDSTSAGWYHRALVEATEARFLLGRVPFIDPDTGARGKNNDRGTTIFVFTAAGGPSASRSFNWRSEHRWLLSGDREAA